MHDDSPRPTGAGPGRGSPPLCRHLNAQPPAQSDDSRNDGFITRVPLHFPDKALIDLHLIDRELLEMRQRGIAGSKIIQCNLDALLMKLCQDGRCMV